ncbi:MAG TPA: FecR domain-containing protein [Terriglobales bacterium]|nr:FecR domain-containing protein [Terriglobales bacterium]
MNSENNQTRNESLTKDNDYLWDGSGEPDPEIRRLEALLGSFHHDRPAPAFPDLVPDRPWWSHPWRMWLFPALATAAVVAIVGGIFLVSRKKPAPVTAAGWNVSQLAGTPRIGRDAVTPKGEIRLAIGQVLETDRQSRARLRAEDVGQIDLEPGTRLHLLNVGRGLKWIALDRGTIHTYIWGPPGQFVVDTPSAVTVDLGCAYTLEVDDSGAGLVRTAMGWVGFKLNGHESFIPAGAACATRPKVGPGTPYFEDSSPELRAALASFDFADNTPEERTRDLAVVLSASRPRDSLTLWHLLTRVDGGQRELVYHRLRALAPPPPRVTKEGILGLDQPMLDVWWNELGFDDISIWRHWERSWSGGTTPAGEK